MTLQLNIDQALRSGRRSVPLDYEVLREVTEADIALLSTVEIGEAPPPLKRITDRHHSLARLIASGTPEDEAALITNYDRSRVSILKNSPAFQELIALYRKEVNAQFSTSLEHMAGLSRDALLELRTRLEDEPDSFTVNELRSIVTELADRTIMNESLDNVKLPTLIELVAPEGSAAKGGAED